MMPLPLKDFEINEKKCSKGCEIQQSIKPFVIKEVYPEHHINPYQVVSIHVIPGYRLSKQERRAKIVNGKIKFNSRGSKWVKPTIVIETSKQRFLIQGDSNKEAIAYQNVLVSRWQQCMMGSDV